MTRRTRGTLPQHVPSVDVDGDNHGIGVRE
jgi:hypothetical protein